ncbi:MAG: hypothetical protein SGI72_15545 [Planctomycetota bacterium]|nr:hypothetical protein [Planctomycetota bacterium]
MSRATPAASSVGARELVFTLLVAACAAPAFWRGSRGEPDPLAALAWVTLIAPAGGFACGARRIQIWPLAPIVPVTWMLVVAAVDAMSARDLPSLAWSALPVTGLFALGFALPSRSNTSPWRGSASLFLVTVLLAALPLHGLILEAAWPPRVAARVLDFAPTTLTAECAGVDWMRHPPIYDGSATVDIDPSLRTPYDPRLAGGLVFVVGSLAAVWRARTRRETVAQKVA